ncbi:sensor histidine kinase [Emticicia soli]|uniref:Sensor histidine kinase n=1 Tax=Emticicia soli TaxID=2027878 RepID=A0ABW5J6L3_9BACT
MVQSTGNSNKKAFSFNKIYLLGLLLMAIPVFVFVNSYTDAVLDRDQEIVAILLTLYFLAGIIIGRYVAILWVPKKGPISKVPFFVLPIIIFICTFVVFIVAQFVSKWDRYFLSMLFFGVPFFILSFASGILIKLVRINVHRQLYEAKAEAQHSQSELHLLQSQLSPHFLFNTLNNLYGLSITEHEKIPPLLLKLSELLRYSVYEAKELFVPLNEELSYIKNYIEFEKIRIGDRLMLKTGFEELVQRDIKIAPMLLIVFVENAFKHSKNTAEHSIQIEIHFKAWGSYLLFSVKNSQAQSKEKSTLDKNSGFGLANVRKRLELLYPNEHILEIENNEDFYQVSLQLKMK